MLIYVLENIVRDILPFTREEALKRLTPEYVDELIEIEDDVKVGMNYIYKDGMFIAPPTPTPRNTEPTTEELINILLGIEVEHE